MMLAAFNTAVTSFEHDRSGRAAAVVAALALAASFALPAAIVASAMRWAGLRRPTPAQRRAKDVAFLAVAAPPLYVFLGVLQSMAGSTIPDPIVWSVFWLGAAAYCIDYGDGPAAAAQAPAPARPALRIAHGLAAVKLIAVFLGVHIANHLAGLLGPEAHASFMKAVRHLYRAPLVEPALVGLFLFQVWSGIRLATGHLSRAMDRFRALQVASGIYLAFYLLGHMNSVFVYARLALRIETDWGFATGEPAGLVADAWNIRLVPHYALGVFFVLAHLASGLRAVLLAHGTRRTTADRWAIGGFAAAAVVALLIILALCGLRLRFA
jgi:hypothetical protein